MPSSAASGRSQALAFLHRVFADEDLRRRLGERPMGLEDLTGLGRSLGLTFAPADLQDVYQQEFALRWAFVEAGRRRSAEPD